MSITRAQAETELVSRQKERMEMVGMAVTVVGTNADLNGPLAYAARKMTLALASPVTVADSDLAALAYEDLDEFFDLAEYRLMLNIKGRFSLVDIKVGPRSESLSQLATALTADIEAKKVFLADNYGQGASTLEAGTISLGFMQDDDEDEWLTL